MKAAFIETCGPIDNIQFGELPTPKVSANQVLVRTAAVSVNPVDLIVRRGPNPWQQPQPFVLGCDIAGVVEQVGADVDGFRVGDRVWGSNQGLLGRQGTFAELAAIDQQWLYPLPPAVPDTTAAACALVGITAHLGLFQYARIKPGETLFVHGGSGGVGAMVVQMARAIGARVMTTASNAEKADVCRRLGAEVVVNYRTDDVAAAVKQWAPNGVNVVWETNQPPDFDALIGHLADGGRLVLMAGRHARATFPVGPFYVKCCSVHGFVMFKAPPEAQRAAALQINQWLTSGQLQPLIGAQLSLSDAALAHQMQEEKTLKNGGKLMGKIVLSP